MSDIKAGMVGFKKTVFNQIVYNSTFKSNPVFIPASIFIRFVTMPFTREKQYNSTCFDLPVFTAVGFEYARPPGNIYELVFV